MRMIKGTREQLRTESSLQTGNCVMLLIPPPCETDLQSLPLLLMPLLHLLQLRIQMFGHLPEPRTLFLIILDLKQADRKRHAQLGLI